MRLHAHAGRWLGLLTLVAGMQALPVSADEALFAELVAANRILFDQHILDRERDQGPMLVGTEVGDVLMWSRFSALRLTHGPSADTAAPDGVSSACHASSPSGSLRISCRF